MTIFYKWLFILNKRALHIFLIKEFPPHPYKINSKVPKVPYPRVSLKLFYNTLLIL